MVENLFETALGIVAPWYIANFDFDAEGHRLSIQIDFKRGSRFSVPGVEGQHPVHDTIKKSYRHLNFFQYTCELEVRLPRVRLPEGGIRQVEPEWAGHLSGFTRLFEAFIVRMSRNMAFSRVAEMVNLSTYHAMAICERYADLAASQRDRSAVRHVAVDETSKLRGHDYVTLVADADQRAVLFVTEGKDATTLERFAEDLTAHGGDPQQIESISRQTCHRPSSKGPPNSFPTPRLPSTSSTSSPMPPRPSTRPGVRSRRPTRRSRACAGSCCATRRT
jgi:transposase